ncbi:MAG: type II toxin-antitoxin system VapC family toxin [Defluviitaleaceae bacterium]|nr:type II toxin-antitoxin system VapC family toxin [Defluviitaleaceae bacterium]
MKILLDTNIILLSALGKLNPVAEEYILDESNVLYFSTASIWEVVIKRGLDRSDFNVDPYKLYYGLVNNGYNELSITANHALAINQLPKIHKDPFDRILLAQAMVENMRFLTSDALLTQYPAAVIFIG